MGGSAVKNTRLTKEGKTIICKTDNFVPLVVPGLSTSSGINSSSTSTVQDFVFNIFHWCGSPSKTQNKNKKRDGNLYSHDSLRDLPEWLEEFTDNLEDTEVHAPAHISQDSDSERRSKVVSKSRKHIIYTHFPKDRNCEVCLRSKMPRAPCRRLTGEAPPRAEKFGDLITADHKVLNEEGESQNSHRYAVVVQDLAIQWIQSCPCKTKTLQETEKSLRKFFEPSEKPKVIYTDTSLEFGKYCEDLSWNLRTSTPHRSETNGIAERAVRRIKEGTSAVLLQSGLDENSGLILWNAITIREMSKTSGRGEKPLCERTNWRHIQRAKNCFGAIVEYNPISVRDLSTLHQFGKEVLPGIFLGYALISRRIWKRDIFITNLEELETVGRTEVNPPSINAQEVLISQKGEEFIFPVADGAAKLSGRDYEFPEPTPRRNKPQGVKISVEHFKANWESLNRQNQKMALKPVSTSGQFKVTSSIVITMNLEFNSVCRTRKHSLLHWNTCM